MKSRYAPSIAIAIFAVPCLFGCARVDAPFDRQSVERENVRSAAWAGHERVRDILKQPVHYTSQDMPLDALLNSVSRTFGLSILLDKRVVPPADPDVLRVPGQEYATDRIARSINHSGSLGEVLTDILAPLSLDYSVQDNFVWVSTAFRLRHETFEDLETRTYDTSDPAVARLFQLLIEPNLEMDAGSSTSADGLSMIAIDTRASDGSPVRAEYIHDNGEIITARATTSFALPELAPDILDPVSKDAISFLAYDVRSGLIRMHHAPSVHERLAARIPQQAD